MALLLVGLAVIALPVAIALRTVLRLTRGLGAFDAAAIGEFLERAPGFDLASVRDRVAVTPASIAHRLLRAVTDDDRRVSLDQKLALAEAVADVERDLVDDARVPRVAASLATTGGLLAAALVVREGLGATIAAENDPLPFFTRVIERGLTLAAMAVLGGVVCATLHRLAQQQRRARLGELDALAAPLASRLTPDRT